MLYETMFNVTLNKRLYVMFISNEYFEQSENVVALQIATA